MIYAGNSAAVEIEHGKRLQHVIELTTGEINLDCLVAANLAEVFEVANSGLIKNDATYGQLCAG